MNDLTDQELLRDYSENRSEAAFSQIVSRHIDLVYTAALRMVRDSHSAEDVTQAAFVALAQNAAQLMDRPVLAGWLHCTARNLAVKTVRSEVRRRTHEQEAVAMNELLSAESTTPWEHIAPHLDDALIELSGLDRDALLLRYFERKSAQEIGHALGISHEAAQKRVSRAVERLREFLAKRGITVGASGLVVVITANGVQAAPLGLAVSISTAATLAGTAVLATTAATATKAIAMTTLKKSLIAAVIVAGAGTGILYETNRASALNERVQTLQRELSPLATQVEALRLEREESMQQLAALRSQIEALRRNAPELLRLRAEVTRLRAELIASSENAPTASEALSWLERLKQLKERLEEMPECKIPELEFLSERDWLNVARDTVVTNDASLRSAFSQLRKTSKEKFSPLLSGALRAYARAHDNQLPAEVLELQSYFHPPVSEAMLRRYEFTQTGSLKWEEPAIAEKAPADERADTVFKIGAGGFWYSSVPGPAGSSGSSTYSTNDPLPRPPWIDEVMDWKPPGQSRDNSAEVKNLERILDRPFKEFEAVLAAQHRETEDPSEVLPYLQTPAEKAAFERLMQLEKEDDKAIKAADAYSEYLQRVIKAMNQFTAANPGKLPQTPADLSPYLTTPEDKAALQEVLRRSGGK